MSVGLFQLGIIALVLLVLFGRGRISETMGDFGKGIKSFRQGLEAKPEPLVAPVEADAPIVAAESAQAEKAN